MTMSRRRNSTESLRLSRFTGPVLFAIAAFYLVWHSLNGERGIYAYFKQSRNLEATQIELASLQERRTILETRVKLMHDDSIDPDLLDEQARRVLGLAKASEIVLIVEPGSLTTKAQ